MTQSKLLGFLFFFCLVSPGDTRRHPGRRRLWAGSKCDRWAAPPARGAPNPKQSRQSISQIRIYHPAHTNTRIFHWTSLSSSHQHSPAHYKTCISSCLLQIAHPGVIKCKGTILPLDVSFSTMKTSLMLVQLDSDRYFPLSIIKMWGKMYAC